MDDETFGGQALAQAFANLGLTPGQHTGQLCESCGEPCDCDRPWAQVSGVHWHDRCFNAGLDRHVQRIVDTRP